MYIALKPCSWALAAGCISAATQIASNPASSLLVFLCGETSCFVLFCLVWLCCSPSKASRLACIAKVSEMHAQAKN